MFPARHRPRPHLCQLIYTAAPKGGTVGMAHFADGEIEARSRHRSLWQGQGPELCVSLSLPQPHLHGVEGEAGRPSGRAHLEREAQLLNGGSPPGLGCSEGAHCCAA